MEKPTQMLLFQKMEMIPRGDGSYVVKPVGKPEQWMWVKKAADQYGVSADAVRDWIHDGLIVGRRVGKRKLQVDVNSLEAYIQPFNYLK
jgi:hypothetical protein